MKTNYTNYKAEQLLEDDFFINSILHPTEKPNCSGKYK